ncbi:MAG TPA: hypothetical protein DCK95_05820 [Anaerolineaceae bacterium]|uniref:Zinc-finger domain-containing protein n=1 Tax=Anaerolinea thermophila TaxID=167964 RepID=A0A101FYR7_9CHLR|nr:MAG: hypothetical protein XD73_0137 [Anaerolinea thermophila]HAF61825.1 hypothetical protein [Anaerolineaceae bacterium]
MNHKQFERWILDDSPLNEEQQQILDAHLLTCEHCQKLNHGWKNSLKAITASPYIAPAAGFSDRWQSKLRFEKKRRSIVRMRVILFSSILLVLVSLLTYIVLSGSLGEFLANLITSSTHILLFLTHGIANLSNFIQEIPSLVRWSAGIFLVGVANIFVILLVVILWKAKKNQEEWQEVRDYGEK